MEFKMTFKKVNKTGQAIFEYFILTSVLMTLVLFFATSGIFGSVRDSAKTALEQATSKILH